MRGDWLSEIKFSSISRSICAIAFVEDFVDALRRAGFFPALSLVFDLDKAYKFGSLLLKKGL